MVESGLNLFMMPPKYRQYHYLEVNDELIQSVKAFITCTNIAKTFAECRRRPAGKLVDPESCKDHAEALHVCYNEVKKIPLDCKSLFENAFNCMKTRGNCEQALSEYVGCPHPASKKYENYH